MHAKIIKIRAKIKHTKVNRQNNQTNKVWSNQTRCSLMKLSSCHGAMSNSALKVPPKRYVVGRKRCFRFNHKIIIKVNESLPSIKVTKKPNGL